MSLKDDIKEDKLFDNSQITSKLTEYGEYQEIMDRIREDVEFLEKLGWTTKIYKRSYENFHVFKWKRDEFYEDAEREKNLDYAMDNMTNDLVYNEETGEWVDETS